MTRLGQMLVDDGIKIGEVRGREEAQRKMNSLINALLTANRTDDCLRATQDADYREKLMRELGIN